MGTVGVGLSLGLVTALTLPPRAIPASVTRPTRQVAGAFHVHSERSDGAASVAEIAADAARAGLDFVVFADHGDATRVPEPPTYISGVLCLDGVEISTRNGHYLALDMPAAPYPLAGEGRDVVADVRRLGGFGVVAHPDSLKAELRWPDAAQVDGLEWINADSEWRDESIARLLLTPWLYVLRGPETIASLLDRPTATLARWDAAVGQRRIVGLPGADAHGKIGGRTDANGSGRPAWMAIHHPGYEAVFRAFSLRVMLENAFVGDASVDADGVYRAIRSGHVFTIVDGIAAPGAVEFEAESGDATATMGDRLALRGPVTVSARVEAPSALVDDLELVLLRDGVPVHRAPAPTLAYDLDPTAAVIRLEGHTSGAPGSPAVPWLMTNPIYIGAAHPSAQPVPAVIRGRPGRRLGLGDRARWGTEADPTSRATIAAPVLDNVLTLEYALGPDPEVDLFVALHHPLDATAPPPHWILFRAWTDRPARLSVQLRESAADRRWQRSVYLDDTPRNFAVAIADMRSVLGQEPAARPNAADSLLFAVDTINTRPGTHGAVSIGDVTVVRP